MALKFLIPTLLVTFIISDITSWGCNTNLVSPGGSMLAKYVLAIYADVISMSSSKSLLSMSSIVIFPTLHVRFAAISLGFIEGYWSGMSCFIWNGLESGFCFFRLVLISKILFLISG